MNKLISTISLQLPEQWQKRGWVAKSLYPLSLIYGLIVNIRQFIYQQKLSKRPKPSSHHSTSSKSHEAKRPYHFPIIVVGNPTVGGVGKTPVVIWLADKLQRMGFQPAVITRGYKGNSPYWPLEVVENTAVDMCGDEALMMYHRLNSDFKSCPVICAPKRIQSIRYIENNFPNTDIVISDDGLQHYAMRRDLEILIIDAKRQLGNQWFLPAGPLRESMKTFQKRLDNGAFLIENSASSKVIIEQSPNRNLNNHNDLKSIDNAKASHSLRFTMTYAGSLVQRVNNRGNKLRLKRIRTSVPINAVAAIGNPKRFFDYLNHLGFHCIETRAFPDHYQFKANDLIFDNDALVMMTEKDAVKCIDIANNKCWFMPITAVFDNTFESQIEAKLAQLIDYAKLPPQLLPDPAVQPKQ